ncbi:hypothetical protein PR048_018819 [Dryococelus australis]|uniref:Uncharacterized protein n=1 Tax=Dryococelus australis TaxID=614101 RepID=A0ABQ9H1V4_9NEOP|nr:hypothetical protein PR048_018819 [Dryococelus australis]
MVHLLKCVPELGKLDETDLFKGYECQKESDSEVGIVKVLSALMLTYRDLLQEHREPHGYPPTMLTLSSSPRMWGSMQRRILRKRPQGPQAPRRGVEVGRCMRRDRPPSGLVSPPPAAPHHVRHNRRGISVWALD